MADSLPHILCVEDDPDIRVIAEAALRDVGGFPVTLCASGLEALERIETVAPDLLVLDVMMPGLDGPTLYQRLQAEARWASLPVIFLTAKAQQHEIAGYREMGALGVITKPFDPMHLADQVLALWSRRDEAHGGA